MKFHENLKVFRLAKKMKQSTIADYIGVNTSTYTNYELGRRSPDLETLVKIASLLEVSTDELLGHRNISHNEKNLLSNINYKSDLHKELISMINYFERDDLLFLKGYMAKLNEKYTDKNYDAQIG